MNIRQWSVNVVTAFSVGVFLPSVSYASDPADAQRSAPQAQERIQKPPAKEERIYGSQLMSREERREHRQKMRHAATAEQREQIRMEHRQKMRERAQERGVKLPDAPPASGQGAGPGPGMGGGMGGGYRP